MKRRSRGFTLMELMITLALAGVLLGIGVPSLRDFQKGGRLTGAANDSLMVVLAARNEALRRQDIGAVCPSADPSATNPTCVTSGANGFISFVDTNSNCQRDAGEDVVAVASIHSEVKWQNNTNCIKFAANGFRLVVAGQPTTSHAIFCDNRGNALRFPTGTDSFARGIEILPTGRPAVSRMYSELATWGVAANPVVCPP
ncbi:MAG: GspH/FimT family pseudopilin [Pseudomonadota bacterium]